jgi:hypothetical protein
MSNVLKAFGSHVTDIFKNPKANAVMVGASLVGVGVLAYKYSQANKSYDNFKMLVNDTLNDILIDVSAEQAYQEGYLEGFEDANELHQELKHEYTRSPYRNH